MSATNVQIPPDSTGAKIGTTERRHFGFDNNITIAQVGDVVVGQTSGAFGTVTSVATEGYISGSGVMHLKEFTDTLFQDNEVLEINATPVSTAAFEVGAQVDVHFQQVILSDPDNPENRQKIDRFGATVNTFTSGSPAFTPFGAMTVGQTQIIKDYRFAYDSEDNLFWDQTFGAGALSHEPARGTILLSTSGTTGDYAKRRSHFYHPYIPGIGNAVEMTIELGDTGKANLLRCWGLFDDDNGLFFEHDATGLNVVVRSNTSGSVVDTKIAQADFNEDKVDGSDSIGFVLDVTKGNIYYVDFQWLGAGRVHFGVFSPEGERILMHVVEHANTTTMPYITTATLPISVEQINTGVVTSTSELRFLCGTVAHTSLTNPDTVKFTAESASVSSIASKPIVSFRPVLTLNSITNRAIASMESLYLVNTSAEPAIVTITAGMSLTGAAFATVGSSALQQDTTASAGTGGLEMRKIVIAPNSTEKILAADDTALHGLALFLQADGATQPTMTINVKSLTASATSVAVVVNWGELRF